MIIVPPPLRGRGLLFLNTLKSLKDFKILYYWGWARFLENRSLSSL